MESFGQLVKMLDGFISATCPGGRRFQGVNSTLATLALAVLVYVAFFKDDSLYSQFIHLVSDVRELTSYARVDHGRIDTLSIQVGANTGRINDLNVQVQVLDHTVVKK